MKPGLYEIFRGNHKGTVGVTGECPCASCAELFDKGKCKIITPDEQEVEVWQSEVRFVGDEAANDAINSFADGVKLEDLPPFAESLLRAMVRSRRLEQAEQDKHVAAVREMFENARIVVVGGPPEIPPSEMN